MDGHFAKRGLAFSNPKLSTKAVERWRKLARFIRRLAAAFDVVTGYTVVALARIAPALIAWADRLDASAKARQMSAATRALHAWAVQETTPTTRTPPAAHDEASMAERAAQERARAVCPRCGKKTRTSWVGETCWGWLNVAHESGADRVRCGGVFKLGR